MAYFARLLTALTVQTFGVRSSNTSNEGWRSSLQSLGMISLGLTMKSAVYGKFNTKYDVMVNSSVMRP